MPPSGPPVVVGGDLPDSTVIGKVDGRELTLGEVRKMTIGLPPQFVQGLLTQPKALETLFLIEYLSKEAEKEGLAQQSPLKEQIEFRRKEMLYQAEIAAKGNPSVSAEEQQKYYNDHKDRYQMAKVHVIFLPFVSGVPNADPKAKKMMTEPEARAKAGELVKQIGAGADIAALAKDYPDLAPAVAKEGGFGVVRGNDGLPPELKTAVFALKPGQTSDPLYQPSGFYIFQLVEKRVQPFEAVQDQVYLEARQQKFLDWFNTYKKRAEVTIDKPEALVGKTSK